MSLKQTLKNSITHYTELSELHRIGEVMGKKQSNVERTLRKLV